jgi:ankyrin repeat protein
MFARNCFIVDFNFVQACRDGNSSKALELINDVTNVNQKDIDNNTALYYAVSKGHLDVVRKLIARGADINIKNNELDKTALHTASVQGHINVVRELIAQGADINIQSKIKDTALIHAINYRHLDVVRELIAQGADIHMLDCNNNSALIKISGNRPLDVQVVRELIAQGADINFQNDYKNTALHVASENGNLDIVIELMAYGAKTGLKNSNNETASVIAFKNCHFETARQLNHPQILHAAVRAKIKLHELNRLIDESSNKNIDEQDEDGNTLLHIARKSISHFIYLINKGANPDVQNNQGKTPLDLVKGNKNLTFLANFILGRNTEDIDFDAIDDLDEDFINDSLHDELLGKDNVIKQKSMKIKREKS